MTAPNTAPPRACALLAAILCLAAQQACRSTPTLDTIDTTAFTIQTDAQPIVNAHNQRAERLSNINARGILSLRFPDPEDPDETRYEQGDLNLQLRTPTDTALVLKKLGETLIWLGSNATDYWLIDDLQTNTAYTGRIDRATPDKLRALALPLSPHELPLLLGIAQLPATASATTNRRDGSTLITYEARGYTVLHTYPSGSDAPAEVEIRTADGTPVFTATTSNTLGVRAPADPFADGPSLIRTTGDTFPATIRFAVHDSQTLVTIQLDNITTARPRDAAFSFDTLLDRFTPDAVIDLDAPDAAQRIHDRSGRTEQ